jgi:hypothetical protein
VTRTPQDEGNDYVECAECGHPLERHTMKGCDSQAEGCPCREAWSYRRISEERRTAGLPVSFERWKF